MTLPALKHVEDEKASYSTESVETHADMWTAKISRVEQTSGGAQKKSSALMDVGSISYLLEIKSD
jgi:hypothetical protein